MTVERVVKYTDICGVYGVKNFNRTVGYLSHVYDIRDNNNEIVTLTLNGESIEEYHSDSENVMSYSNQLINDKYFDITNPIVAVESFIKKDLHILTSNQLYTIKKNTPKNVVSDSISFVILTPGSAANKIKRFAFLIPSSFNFNTKILYIKDFNMFISARDLQELKQKLNTVQNDFIAKIHPIRKTPAIDIQFLSSTVNQSQCIYFDINGIQGMTHIEKSPDTKNYIILNIDGNNPIVEELDNNAFEFIEPGVFKWEIGDREIILGIDNDFDRLRSSIKIFNNGMISTNDRLNKNITNLRAENQDKDKKLSDRDKAIVEKEKKIDELTDQISILNDEISYIKREDAREKERIQKEREEIKLKAAQSSSKVSELSDIVKIASLVISAIPIITSCVKFIGSMLKSKPKKEAFTTMAKLMCSKESMIIGGVGLLGFGATWLFRSLQSNNHSS